MREDYRQLHFSKEEVKEMTCFSNHAYFPKGGPNSPRYRVISPRYKFTSPKDMVGNKPVFSKEGVA